MILFIDTSFPSKSDLPIKFVFQQIILDDL